MILPDVNVLVYAHRKDMDQHLDYAAWITGVAEGDEPFVLSSTAVASFVRVVTHPRIFTTPSPQEAAIDYIDALAESPRCRWLEPAERWWSIFTDLCRRSGARGNVVPDAVLASVAIEYGCRVATADRGFARFPGLRWFHPLEH